MKYIFKALIFISSLSYSLNASVFGAVLPDNVSGMRPYEQFISRFEFCDPNAPKPHSLLPSESCLSKEEKRNLKFLCFVYENKEKFTAIPKGKELKKFIDSFSRITEEKGWMAGLLLGFKDSKPLQGLPDILTYQVYFYLENFFGLYNLLITSELIVPDQDEKAGQCLKKLASPDAQNYYANLLRDKRIHKTWSGMDVKDDDRARFNDCAQLYIAANTPHSKYNYANLLSDKRIHKTWSGMDVEHDDRARFDECVRLYKEANISYSKHNYANLLSDRRIHKTWSGMDVKDDDRARFNDCGQLYIATNTPHSKYNYAVLLNHKKIHKTWSGMDVEHDDQARFTECARLYREANTPDAKYNYTVLLRHKKIHKTWSGVDVKDDDHTRFNDCAQLYREANTPNAKLNYFDLILSSGIRIGYEGEVLGSDEPAFRYVLKALKSMSERMDYKSYLTLLAMTKLMNNDKNMYDEAYDLYRQELSNGNPEIDEKTFALFFTSEKEEIDIPEEEKTKLGGGASQQLGDIPQDTSKGSPEARDRQMKKERQMQSTRAKEKAKAAEAPKESSDEEKFQEQQRVERASAWKKYTNLSNEEKTNCLKIKMHDCLREKEKPYDFCHYRVVCDDGTDYTSDNAKINELLQDIKDRRNSGQVHALQGKRINGEILITRKITAADRLVYAFHHDQNQIVIYQDKGHYED